MIERRSTRIRRRDWIRDFWMLALTVFIAVLLNGLVNTSNEARHASEAAKAQAITVQEQRIETIGKSCEDQNRRLDDSILATAHALGYRDTMVTSRLLAKLKRNKRVAPFLTILQAQQPHQDCRQVVFNATGFDPGRSSTYPGGAQ